MSTACDACTENRILYARSRRLIFNRFQRVAVARLSTSLISSGEIVIYIKHEFLAHGANFLAESSAEHHHLFLMGSVTENFLYVTSHICTRYNKIKL